MPVKLKTALNIMEATIRAYMQNPLGGPDRPAFMIWSGPGIGKSAGVHALGHRLGMHVEPVIVANYDPGDFPGINMIYEGGMRRTKPDWFPDPSVPTIIFFDELPAAAILNQNVVSQALSEDRVGRLQIPPRVVFICAGNRRTDRAGTTEMPMHIRNRVSHFEVEADVHDWIDDFATKIGPSGQSNITPETIAYLKARPEHFYLFDPMKNVNAWPTPRTWTKADFLFKCGLSDRDLLLGLTGYLGEAVAEERMNFYLKAKSIPKAAEIYRDPHNAPIPTEPDLFDTVVTILISRARVPPVFHFSFSVHEEGVTHESERVDHQDMLRIPGGVVPEVFRLCLPLHG